jgi:hypothetical protein
MPYDRIPSISPDESPRDRAQRLVNSLVHSALAELVLCGVSLEQADGRITATACCRQARLRTILHLVRYDAPAWEPVPSGAAPRPLTGTQRRIVALLDRTTPRTPKWIARRFGKSEVDSYLRHLLRQLCRQGVLRRTDGGYLLA